MIWIFLRSCYTLSENMSLSEDKLNMLRTFIQVTALVLTLEAAIFLAKGNLGLSPQVIAELGATKVAYNDTVLNSLCKHAYEI